MNTNLSQAENDFLRHVQMWGNESYPVRKVGRHWQWVEFWGVKGAPTLYRTKRACVEAIENYISLLCDKAAGRV